MKKSESETDFEEISFPFNEKIIKIRKSEVLRDSDPLRIYFVASRDRFVELLSSFFNNYVNEYVVINEHIPSDGYHIYQPLRSGRMWHKVNF